MKVSFPITALLSLSFPLVSGENSKEPDFLSAVPAVTGGSCPYGICSGEQPRELILPRPCNQNVLDLFCQDSVRAATSVAFDNCNSDSGASSCFCSVYQDPIRTCTMVEKGNDCVYNLNSYVEGTCAGIYDPLYCPNSGCYGSILDDLYLNIPFDDCHRDSAAVTNVCNTASEGAAIMANLMCNSESGNPNCSCKPYNYGGTCDATMVQNLCKVSVNYGVKGDCYQPPTPSTCSDNPCEGRMDTRLTLQDCSDAAVASFCYQAEVDSITFANKQCTNDYYNPSCSCAGKFSKASCRVQENADKSCTVNRSYQYEGTCKDSPVSPYCSYSSCNSQMPKPVVKKVKGSCKPRVLQKFCLEAKLRAKLEADLSCDLANDCECKGYYSDAQCYSAPIRRNGASHCTYVTNYSFYGYCAGDYYYASNSK